MGASMRKIVARTFTLQSDGDEPAAQHPPDSYTDKLLKLIPAESITTYIAINGILKSAATFNPIADWFIFIVIMIGTAFYLKQRESTMSYLQMGISCFAFLAYVLAQGAVFERQIPGYSTIYGAILVPLVV